jgi:hypothetical protein
LRQAERTADDFHPRCALHALEIVGAERPGIGIAQGRGVPFAAPSSRRIGSICDWSI